MDSEFLTPRSAEIAVAQWLRWAGHRGVTATPYAQDGGIDVESRSAVAQVKFQAKPVGRPALQALFGAAAVKRKESLFFSLGGYTNQALAWAKEAGMSLFAIDDFGRISPVNKQARDFLALVNNADPPPKGVAPEASHLSDGTDAWSTAGILAAAVPTVVGLIVWASDGFSFGGFLLGAVLFFIIAGIEIFALKLIAEIFGA